MRLCSRASRAARCSGVRAVPARISRSQSASTSGRSLGKHVDHGGGALLPDKIVRVDPLRQEREGDAVTRFQPGQGNLDGAVGGLSAGAVAVEAENGFWSKPPQKFQLIFGQRRSEGGHCFAEARFAKRHDVHVALNNYNAVFFVSSGTVA